MQQSNMMSVLQAIVIFLNFLLQNAKKNEHNDERVKITDRRPYQIIINCFRALCVRPPGLRFIIAARRRATISRVASSDRGAARHKK